MSPLPDPTELEALAGRIRAHAAATRDRARRLEQLVAVALWRGVAAGVFDVLAAEVVGGLRHSAARLDDAADALLRHAANVRHLLAALAELQHDTLEVGADVLTDAGHVLGGLGALIGIG